MPASYICRRSYAMWELLLPDKEIAEKMSRNNLTWKHLSMRPEYQGKRRSTVSVLGVPCYLGTRQLGSVLSQFGEIETVCPVRGPRSLMTGDYKFVMRVDRAVLDRIPAVLKYDDWTMTVIVEGRRPHCWYCQKQGHMARDCPKKTTTNARSKLPEGKINIAAPAPATATDENGWSKVVRKNRPGNPQTKTHNNNNNNKDNTKQNKTNKDNTNKQNNITINTHKNTTDTTSENTTNTDNINKNTTSTNNTNKNISHPNTHSKNNTHADNKNKNITITNKNIEKKKSSPVKMETQTTTTSTKRKLPCSPSESEEEAVSDREEEKVSAESQGAETRRKGRRRHKRKRETTPTGEDTSNLSAPSGTKEPDNAQADQADTPLNTPLQTPLPSESPSDISPTAEGSQPQPVRTERTKKLPFLPGDKICEISLYASHQRT